MKIVNKPLVQQNSREAQLQNDDKITKRDLGTHEIIIPFKEKQGDVVMTEPDHQQNDASTESHQTKAENSGNTMAAT